MSTEIVDQPPPRPRSDVVSIQALVREDLTERERIGVQRYGTPLQARNGRNPLIDAYQEAMDLTLYLRQAIDEERGAVVTGLKAEIARLTADQQRSRDLIAELRRQLDSAWRRLGIDP